MGTLWTIAGVVVAAAGLAARIFFYFKGKEAERARQYKQTSEQYKKEAQRLAGRPRSRDDISRRLHRWAERVRNREDDT